MSRKIKVWVVSWPKGTTEGWKDEEKPPVDYDPISVESRLEFTYRSKAEGGRVVLGAPLAVFGEKAEAAAWSQKDGSDNCFNVYPAWLEVKG